MSSTAIRVAIIDDHQVFADALASRLGEDHDLPWSAPPGRQRRWKLLSGTPVDVVALDLDLAGEDGLRLGREILAAGPTSASWSSPAPRRRCPASSRRCRWASAAGSTRPTRPTPWWRRSRAAGRGESRIPADMLTKALMYLSAGGPAATPEQEAIGRLTNRERDVLYGLMDGLSRTQIGELLKVSPNTVRTHVQSILSKLNVHSALGAVALARKAGVSRDPPSA